MPKLIDFKCEKCEFVFEEMTSPTWDDPTCPECASEALEELFCAPKLGFMNIPERRHEALKKRADAHTRKEQRVGNAPGRAALGIKD